MWRAIAHHSSVSHSYSRGLGHEWRPCVVDIARKHCDVDHPAFWQTIHTLRVTETNGLGSKTTLVRLKLHDLCKITQNAHINMAFPVFDTNVYFV